MRERAFEEEEEEALFLSLPLPSAGNKANRFSLELFDFLRLLGIVCPLLFWHWRLMGLIFGKHEAYIIIGPRGPFHIFDEVYQLKMEAERFDARRFF